jgi:hypothetical protein
VAQSASGSEKAVLSADTTAAVEASERECFLRLAAILLGVDATRKMYPDAVHLTDLRGAS